MSRKIIYFIFIISLLLGIGSLLMIKYLTPEPKTKAYEVVKVGKAAIGGDFELLDVKGKQVSSKDFRDKYLLVYFGFTFCPDICPTALYNIKEVIDNLPIGIQSEVVPIFITIDPNRDTIANLAHYMEQFEGKIVGLTGSEEQVKKAIDQYRVYRQKIENPNEPENYLLDHSSFIYFMDKNGEYISHFGHNTNSDEIVKFISKTIVN